MKGFTFALLAALGVAWLGAASPAEAAFRLRIDNGNNGSFETLVTDQDFVPVAPDTAPDGNPLPGVLQFSGAVGAFTVVVSVGTSKPVIGNGEMDLLQLAVSGGAGTIAIELTDTGFSPLTAAYRLSVGGTTSNGNAALLLFSAGGGDSNTEFDLTPGTGVIPGTFVAGGPSFVANGSFAAPTANPYSLTIRAVVQHTAGGQITSFDAFLSPVPAPPALVLALTGVPVFGLAYLRRRLRKQ